MRSLPCGLRSLTHSESRGSRSSSASLNKGGLYFIQNMGVDWSVDWTKPQTQSWVTERDGIVVKTTFEIHVKDVINQIITEKTVLEVDDNGQKRTFTEEEDLKLIFPQEFKLLVGLNGKFEFLGWWKGSVDTWYLDQPLEKVEDLNINMVLLRRK